jgi:hypothetical protein
LERSIPSGKCQVPNVGNGWADSTDQRNTF